MKSLPEACRPQYINYERGEISTTARSAVELVPADIIPFLRTDGRSGVEPKLWGADNERLKRADVHISGANSMVSRRTTRTFLANLQSFEASKMTIGSSPRCKIA